MLAKVFILLCAASPVPGQISDFQTDLVQLIAKLKEFHSTSLFSMVMGSSDKKGPMSNRTLSDLYLDICSQVGNNSVMLSNKLEVIKENTVVIFLTWETHFENNTMAKLIQSSVVAPVYVVSPNLFSIPDLTTNIPFTSKLYFVLQSETGAAKMVEAYHVSTADKTLRTREIGTRNQTSGVWNIHRIPRNNLFGVEIRFVQKVDGLPIGSDDQDKVNNSYFESWAIMSRGINFTYKLTYIFVDPKTEDPLFPGSLALIRDGKADVSLDNFFLTPTNVNRVGILKPVISVWTAIFTKKPEFRTTSWSFLTVFTTNVWLSVLATYVALSAAYYVHLLYFPDDVHAPADCFIIVLGTFSGKGLTTFPQHLSTRILLITILLLGYLLNNFFVFLLLGRLTYKTPSLPFETLEDLIRLQPSYSLNVHISSPVVSGSKTATSGPLVTIGQLLSKHPGSVHPNVISMVDKACAGNAAFLEFTSKYFSYEYFVNKCQLMRTKSLYFHNYLYIATRKDFPYKVPISNIGMKIQESGLLDRITEVTMSKRAFFQDEVPKITVIDMEMVMPIFLTYLLLVIFSLIFFLIELYWKHRKSSC